MCIRDRIDGVSIGIRLLAFPSARGFALVSARDSVPRQGNPLWPSRANDSELRPRCILSRLLMFQSAHGCSAFPPPEGSIFSLPEMLAPTRGILFSRDGLMIKCSSRDGLLTKSMVFQSAYGCSLFRPPEGSLFSLPETLFPARGIRSG